MASKKKKVQTQQKAEKKMETDVENKVVEEIPQEEQLADVEKLEKEKVEEIDYKARFLYLAAEMENLKKRHERERNSFVKYGNDKILKELIGVIDNFDRSIGALKNDEDEKVRNIVVGIEMVQNQFLDVLAANGLETIETEGKKFDPNFHEAMTKQEVKDKEEDEIISEFQKGYLLNGRLLRASKVIVAK